MADIVDTLRNSNGDNVFPIAGGMMANSINTSMLKDGAVTTGKIADGNVTQEKLALALFNRFPRAIAQGSTTTSNNLSFDVGSDLNFCWIVFVSKYSTDGTSAGMFFIRCGATAVSTITGTGSGGDANYSVSKTAITGGYRINLTSSTGDLRYAKYTVYQFMTP